MEQSLCFHLYLDTTWRNWSAMQNGQTSDNLVPPHYIVPMPNKVVHVLKYIYQVWSLESKLLKISYLMWVDIIDKRGRKIKTLPHSII